MKPRTHIFKYLLATLLPMAVAGQLPLSAAPPSQKAKLEIQPSVFNVPTSASEGRDPFFPASTRVFATSETQTRGPALTDLTLKSILGTSPHVFAIINNHTFATGDDGRAGVIACRRMAATIGPTAIQEDIPKRTRRGGAG